MAIRHGVTIVPFAAIGADDAFKLAMDRDELKQTRLGSFLGRMGIKDDYLVPLPSSVVPTLADSTFASCQLPLPSGRARGRSGARGSRSNPCSRGRGIEALAGFTGLTPRQVWTDGRLADRSMTLDVPAQPANFTASVESQTRA